MKTVTIHEAKTILSRLIEKAGRGEEIISSRARSGASAGSDRWPQGAPKARHLEGELVVGREFFEPLPPEELERWE